MFVILPSHKGRLQGNQVIYMLMLKRVCIMLLYLLIRTIMYMFNSCKRQYKHALYVQLLRCYNGTGILFLYLRFCLIKWLLPFIRCFTFCLFLFLKLRECTFVSCRVSRCRVLQPWSCSFGCPAHTGCLAMDCMYRGKGGRVFTLTLLVRLSKNVSQEDANPFYSSNYFKY